MGGGKDPFSKLLGLEPPETPAVPITEEQRKELLRSDKLGRLGKIGLSGVTPLPKFPEQSEQDRIRMRAIAERLRKAMLTGKGRAATIATSPLGVTNGAKLQRRQLTGA